MISDDEDLWYDPGGDMGVVEAGISLMRAYKKSNDTDKDA